MPPSLEPEFPASKCRGCGTVLEDPTQDEVNQAVDDVLVASLNDAKKRGEICPLCGHSQAQPASHRKSVLFGLLLAALLVAIGLAIAYSQHRSTERQAAAQDALKQIKSNTQVVQLLGEPVSIRGAVQGSVKQDETGWREAKLIIPVHGPKADGALQVSGGRGSGQWKFTTLEVMVPQLKKKADLITGRIVEYDPDAYVETHFEAASIPEGVLADAPAPRWNGDFPCVYATADPGFAPQIGSCTTPVPMSKASRTPVDRFETDLRTGKFILRQTDLTVQAAGFNIPLTRTYTSEDWLPQNKSHAFGMNSSHPYDIAPLGTRNPYTEQYIVLEDGDFLYFPRISKGTGYSDAVYRQSEVGNSFYKAIQRWDGAGWLMQLQDGSTIHFPESYNASNLAQGAPTEMTDSSGNRIDLIRDRRRNLKEIRGPDGASIKLAYDDNDRIVQAEDGHGKWTKYTYSSSGRLTDVVHSDGAARHYVYQDGLLVVVRDERDHVLVRNSYDRYNKLTQQEYEAGGTVQYLYHSSSNQQYADWVAIALPNGQSKNIQLADSVSEAYKRIR